ncbi:MAG: nuclear transport factor 2 family protein [Cyclobacteriaceae bacterium]|nr:nuclear transport factor 2 family protein [Cyclobacteriaceae bacterium]
MITESELVALSLEKFKVWESFDLNKFDELFDAEGLLICYNGKPETKTELLQEFQNPKRRLNQVSVGRPIVRIFGTTAVVHAEGAMTMISSGKEETHEMNFLDVWVQRETGWKLVSVHFNHVN